MKSQDTSTTTTAIASLFIKANALGTYTGRLLVIVKSLIDECESQRKEARSFLSSIEEYGKSYEYLKSTNPPLSKAVADNLDKAGAQAVKALQEFKSYQPTVVDSPDLHEYFLLQVRDQLSPAVDALKDTYPPRLDCSSRRMEYDHARHPGNA